MSAIKHVGEGIKEFLKNGAISISKRGGFKVAGAFAVCAAIGVGFAGSGSEPSSAGTDHVELYDLTKVMDAQFITESARALHHLQSDVSGGHFEGVSGGSSLTDAQRAEVARIVEEVMSNKGQKTSTSSPAEMKADLNMHDAAGEFGPDGSKDITVYQAYANLEECMAHLNILAPGLNNMADTPYMSKDGDRYECISDPGVRM